MNEEFIRENFCLIRRLKLHEKSFKLFFLYKLLFKQKSYIFKKISTQS